MSNVAQLNLLPESSNRLSHLKASQLSLPEQDHLILLALDVLSLRYQPGEVMDCPDRMRDYLRLRFGELEYEIFSVVFLDNRHRIIQFDELFRGTIDGCSVHSRIVVQRALECNAAAVILGHNHPSGVAEPSSADKTITHRLKEALALVDVRVLDHLIVTRGSIVSFAERGLI
ncbi:MAG: JAB domain-containing protein [Pseudomonadota bacterium]